MAVSAVPTIVRERLGDAVAEALAEWVGHLEERAKDRTLEVVEERFERRVAEETGKLRVEIQTMRAELTGRIEGVRAEIIKWMFIFWVGQVGTLTAILFAFFKR